MARTPDRSPGEADEEGLVFENRTAGDDPTVAGGMRYVNGAFRMRDADGVFDPRGGDSTILLETDPDMVGIDYVVTRDVNDFVTQELWSQTSNSFAVKSIDYGHDVDGNVQTATVKVYDLADGVTITAQKTITYAYVDGSVVGATITRDV